MQNTPSIDFEILRNLHEIKKNWDMPDELLEKIHGHDPARMRSFIQIYRRLNNFYPEQVENQKAWWNRPNAAFQGLVPIQVLTEIPENLSWVAYVLETQWETRQ